MKNPTKSRKKFLKTVGARGGAESPQWLAIWEQFKAMGMTDEEAGKVLRMAVKGELIDHPVVFNINPVTGEHSLVRR